MRPPLHRAAGLSLLAALTGLLAACGGGFSSAPPPPPDRTLRSYVALGDGFTAAPYTGKTVGDDGCLRSDVSYPALVADDLGIDDVTDVSCTGATTNALTTKTKPAKGKPSVPAQLDAVGKDTDLVTIGIGIEDDALLQNMFRICTTQPCAPGTVIYTSVLDAVARAADNLGKAVRKIQEKAPDSYIVVVGYPRITPLPGGSCDAYPAQPTLPDGTDPVTYVLNDLNSKLQAAARQTGSGYVDVASLSTDHVLCSAEPWVHDMRSRPGKAVAYHPVAAEQHAVAAQVATEVRQR